MTRENNASGDNREWVIVKTYPNPIAAHLAQSALEQQGVVSLLDDQAMTGMYGGSAIRIRIRVPPSQAARAAGILEDLERRPPQFEVIEGEREPDGA